MATEKVQVELILNDGSVQKAFVKIEQGAENFGRKAGESLEDGLSSGLGNVTTNLKNQLIGLGAAFAGLSFIKNIASNFTDLETAFAEIKTVLPDVASGTDRLRQSFVDLSGEFGTSAASQANAFYSIVSAGITDTALAQEALTSANKLAIGGLTSTGTAIDILTTSINAYGAENLSAEKAADVLFGTVRLGKTTVGELAGSLGQILPTASSLKVGFEDIAGAVAALTTKGVSTSAAVTQLNSVLTAVLSKQAEAKKLGPGVAKAFSLQALQAKGFAGFLKDLNFELGGSEQALVKLLGSAEAARAVLALSGDGFVALGNNIETLKTKTGAADDAFKIISQTTAEQTNQIFSKINALFFKLSSSGSGAVFSIISATNQALGSLIANFDAIANRVIAVTQKIVAGLIALRIGPSIFRSLSSGLSGLIREFSILPTRLALAKLNLQQFKLSLKTLSFRGAVRGLKSFRVGMKLTRIGMKAFRLGVKLLKVGLTFGIGLAIDFLIEKFIELKDSFGGIGNLFQSVVLSVRKAFNTLIISVIDFIKKAEQLPIIGAKIKANFGGTFDAIKVNAVDSLKTIGDEFVKLQEKIKLDTTPEFVGPLLPDIPTTADVPLVPPIDQEQFNANKLKVEAALDETTKKTKKAAEKQVSITEAAWSAIAGIIGVKGFEIQVSQKKLEMASIESFKKIANAATEGFARSFASIGEAIVKGENAFEAFGKNILGVLGDVAIQAGTMYTLLGIASFNPAQVAAGIGLTILGGVIKALAGGGGSSASSGGGGGGLSSNPIDGDTSPITQPTQVGSQVGITIQGDVLDGEETGLRIAEILKDQGFQNSVITA